MSDTNAIRCATSTLIDTPVGPLTLKASPRGLTGIRFGHYEASPGAPIPRHLTDAGRQLEEYFSRTRCEFELPLDLHGTPFQMRVWKLLSTIPYGRTTTYGYLAARLGDAKLARAVGCANGANPLPIVLPCHRVIGGDGRLVGFGGGLERKVFLLRHESCQTQLFQL